MYFTEHYDLQDGLWRALKAMQCEVTVSFRKCILVVGLKSTREKKTENRKMRKNNSTNKNGLY